MLVAFVSCLVLIVLANEYRRRQRLRLPPGPPADPVWGHLRLLRRTRYKDELYLELSKTYGDVIYLNNCGKSTIVLNSEEAAKDLLEKRGAIYSDRPVFPLMKAIGWGDMFGWTSINEDYTKQRKITQLAFARKSMHAYKEAQEEEVSILLHALLEKPRDFERHLHRLTTGIILNIVYGHRITSYEDRCFKVAENFIVAMGGIARPSLLDISPRLEKVPSWFPGAWHVRFIEESKPWIQAMIDDPMKLLIQKIGTNTAQSCIASREMERMNIDNKGDSLSMYTLTKMSHQLFRGGTETTWHSLSTFIMCMMQNPHVQKRAQAEIDTVVGQGRLPDFTDRDSLPFIECVVKETMRWHPVVPLGVPHYSTADDEYRGWHIPRGSTIIANSRAMTLDESKFSDPHAFVPERFLPKPEGRGEVFNESIVFGWGRRMCVGRLLAESTMWLAMVHILAAFDISKPKDEEGNDIEQSIRFIPQVTSHPEPYECVIIPRSDRAKGLVNQAYYNTYQATHADPSTTKGETV